MHRRTLALCAVAVLAALLVCGALAVPAHEHRHSLHREHERAGGSDNAAWSRPPHPALPPRPPHPAESTPHEPPFDGAEPWFDGQRPHAHPRPAMPPAVGRVPPDADVSASHERPPFALVPGQPRPAMPPSFGDADLSDDLDMPTAVDSIADVAPPLPPPSSSSWFDEGAGASAGSAVDFEHDPNGDRRPPHHHHHHLDRERGDRGDRRHDHREHEHIGGHDVVHPIAPGSAPAPLPWYHPMHVVMRVHRFVVRRFVRCDGHAAAGAAAAAPTMPTPPNDAIVTLPAPAHGERVPQPAPFVPLPAVPGADAGAVAGADAAHSGPWSNAHKTHDREREREHDRRDRERKRERERERERERDQPSDVCGFAGLELDQEDRAAMASIILVAVFLNTIAVLVSLARASRRPRGVASAADYAPPSPLTSDSNCTRTAALSSVSCLVGLMCFSPALLVNVFLPCFARDRKSRVGFRLGVSLALAAFTFLVCFACAVFVAYEGTHPDRPEMVHMRNRRATRDFPCIFTAATFFIVLPLHLVYAWLVVSSYRRFRAMPMGPVAMIPPSSMPAPSVPYMPLPSSVPSPAGGVMPHPFAPPSAAAAAADDDEEQSRGSGGGKLAPSFLSAAPAPVYQPYASDVQAAPRAGLFAPPPPPPLAIAPAHTMPSAPARPMHTAVPAMPAYYAAAPLPAYPAAPALNPYAPLSYVQSQQPQPQPYAAMGMGQSAQASVAPLPTLIPRPY